MSGRPDAMDFFGPTPVDTALLRAAFTQAQSQIMNNGQFEPVVVISKPLALQLLDEIDRLREAC